jgi:hypothetical protein
MNRFKVGITFPRTRQVRSRAVYQHRHSTLQGNVNLPANAIMVTICLPSHREATLLLKFGVGLFIHRFVLFIVFAPLAGNDALRKQQIMSVP